MSVPVQTAAAQAFAAPNASERLAAILRPPFDRYTPAQLLEHIHDRTGVAYFPIVDPDEARCERIDAVLANLFEFAGETHELVEPIDWIANPSADIEWHILLHKFYFAVGLGERFDATGDPRYLGKWMQLTDSWIASAPVDFIAADVTGRRIQNWIYAHYFFLTKNRPSQLCVRFYGRFVASLHDQVATLIEQLAPARNHRTLELYAVFLAAVVFPEWRAAAQWREQALAALAANVASDLLADGVHCELATDYHHLVLRNLLAVRRLARLNGIAVPPAMDAGIMRALDFSLYAHQPAGTVPAFSDGDVHDYRALLAEGYAEYGREDWLYAATGGQAGSPPRERSRAFPDGGYYVMRGAWTQPQHFADAPHLMLDCGPLGAGNHGHFDCLSFELATFGRPLIVDPGRYTYDEGGSINWRAAFRSTAAHNTVLIDGRNQTRYEPGAKRMKVRGPAPLHRVYAWQSVADCDYFHGAALSAEYPVTHERALVFIAPEYWLFADYLEGEGEHRYDLQFQLAPDAHGCMRLERRDGMQLAIAPKLVLAQCDDPRLELALDAGYVSRRYGEKAPAPRVRWTRRGGRAAFHTVLVPYAERVPQLTLRSLPVWIERAGSNVPVSSERAVGRSPVWTERADDNVPVRSERAGGNVPVRGERAVDYLTASSEPSGAPVWSEPSGGGVPVWSEPWRGGVPAHSEHSHGGVPACTGHALVVRFGAGAAQITDTWFVRPHEAAGAWRFGRFRADGRFAFVRENAFGEVLRVHVDAGTRLDEVARSREGTPSRARRFQSRPLAPISSLDGQATRPLAPISCLDGDATRGGAASCSSMPEKSPSTPISTSVGPAWP